MKITKEQLKRIIKEELKEAYKAPRDFGRKPVPFHQGTSTMMRDAPTPEERQQDFEEMLTIFDEAALQVKSINIEDEESMKNARASLDRVGRMIYDIQSHLDQSTYYQDDLDFAKEPDPYGDEDKGLTLPVGIDPWEIKRRTEIGK